MGVITNLISMGQAKKYQDQQNQVRAFDLASKSDDPQLRQWGIQSLVDLGEKNAPNPEVKKQIPVLGQFAHMLSGLKNLNPVPSAPKPAEGPAPRYDPARAEIDRTKRADEETRVAAARDKTIKQQDADIEQSRQIAVEKARLDIDDLIDKRRTERDDAEKNKLRDDARKRLEGIKNILSPDEYRRVLTQIETGSTLPQEQSRKQTTVELTDGTTVPAWESVKPGEFETLDHKPIDPKTIRSIGGSVEPKYSGELKTRIEANKIANDPKASKEEKDAAKATLKGLDTKAAGVTIRNEIAGSQVSGTPAKPIEPGTNEFKVAQDLAYGKLTFSQFRGLFSYSRDATKREAIYNKASELNPNFNAASFESGFKFASSRQTQQQLAALDNVNANTDSLLELSDKASRTGAPILNKFIVPGGIAVGGKRYSTFAAARKAFADELSGALGFGTATDKKLELAHRLTDPHLSPAGFRQVVEEVIKPFVANKKGTMLKQMGVYGEPGMNPAAGPAGGTGAKKPEDLKNLSTDDLLKRLAGGK